MKCCFCGKEKDALDDGVWDDDVARRLWWCTSCDEDEDYVSI